MALPIVPLARDTVTIGGTDVSIRAMSRAEALRLKDYKGREDEAELLILVAGTGCTEDEARAFREGNDTRTAGSLVDAILVLSGLATAEQILSLEDADEPVDPISPPASERS